MTPTSKCIFILLSSIVGFSLAQQSEVPPVEYCINPTFKDTANTTAIQGSVTECATDFLDQFGPALTKCKIAITSEGLGCFQCEENFDFDSVCGLRIMSQGNASICSLCRPAEDSDNRTASKNCSEKQPVVPYLASDAGEGHGLSAKVIVFMGVLSSVVFWTTL
jgi:hypothetical protein